MPNAYLVKACKFGGSVLRAIGNVKGGFSNGVQGMPLTPSKPATSGLASTKTIAACIVLVLLAFLLLHGAADDQETPSGEPKLLSSSFARVSRRSKTLGSTVNPVRPQTRGSPSIPCEQPVVVPKVALCFLVRHQPLHNQLWKAWLRSAEGLVPAAAVHSACCGNGRHVPFRLTSVAASSSDSGSGGDDAQRSMNRQQLYTVYVHDRPDSPPYEPDSVFYGHVIPDRVMIGWGEPNMTVAMKNLLRAALEEPTNERFLIMDESTIPLYPADVTYLQVMGETRSRMKACPDQQSETRWSERMATDKFRVEHWRKSAQWSLYMRHHAQLVAEDTYLWDRVQRSCYAVNNATGEEELVGNCLTDEHYSPVVVAWHGLGKETTCLGNVMYVEWKEHNKNPYRYQPEDAMPHVIDHIRRRGENCDPEKTIMAGKRPGNFIRADQGIYSCPAKRFKLPYDEGWPSVRDRNINCGLFNRKWSRSSRGPLFGLMKGIGVIPAGGDEASAS